MHGWARASLSKAACAVNVDELCEDPVEDLLVVVTTVDELPAGLEEDLWAEQHHEGADQLSCAAVARARLCCVQHPREVDALTQS